MSILVDKNTRLVVQGITGGEGTFHTKQMLEERLNRLPRDNLAPNRNLQWNLELMPRNCLA